MFRTLSKNNKHSILVLGVPLAILLSNFQNTFCFELSESLYSIFNFPQQNIITFYDIYSVKKELTAKYSYHDIYRKRINSSPALFSLDNVFFFYGFFPFKFNNINQAIQVKINSNKFRFSNENDRSSVIGTSDLSGITSSIRWSITHGIGLAGVGLDLKSNEGESDFNIVSFPTSDNKAMNSFFLDWLEPSFGRNLKCKYSVNSYRFIAWGSTPLRESYRLSLSVSRLTGENNLQMNYTNSTNKIELNGKRRLDIPVQNRETIISLSLHSSDRVLHFLEAGIIISNLKLNMDNNRTYLLDYESLGGGDFSRSGLFVNCILNCGLYKIWGGLSGASYSSEFDFDTPVLGFYKGIAPISHGAKGQLSKSSSFSQRLGGEVKINVRRITNNISLSYTHARYWFWVTGEAELEFGLVSTSIDYPVNIDANLWDVAYELRYPTKLFDICYRIQQIVPLFKRLDESPIKMRRDIPELKISNRGGQVHEFYISLFF